MTTFDPTDDRLPPCDVMAERMIIHAIVSQNRDRYTDGAFSMLTADAFYELESRRMWESVDYLRSVSRNHAISDVLLRLSEIGRRQQVTDDYIAELRQLEGTYDTIAAQCKRVADLHRLREFISRTRSALAKSFGTIEDVDAFLADAERSICGATEVRQGVEILTGVELAKSFVNRITQAQKDIRAGKKPYRSGRTGMSSVDAKLRAIQPGRMIAVGARPGGGKSAFLLNNIGRAIAEDGKHVVVAGLEMSSDESFKRLMSASTAIGSSEVEKLEYEEAHREFVRALAAMNTWAQSGLLNRFHFVDRPTMTVNDVRNVVKIVQTNLHNKDPGAEIGAVLVDYLQLLQYHGKADRLTREAIVSSFARGMKLMAKELKVPVVIATQLNRGPAQNEGREPTMADIRESGAVEQDADCVVLLWRVENAERPGTIGLKIDKNRCGERGKFEVRFDPERMTLFDD